jgi:hypothetical protein
MRPLALLIPIILAASFASAQESRPSWDRSIVTIEVARKQYEYYQPWSRRTHRAQKTGIVLDDHKILTTADELFDHTLIRLQKNGRGRWWIGDLAWIDYHANLALLTNSDAEFWKDLKPVTFGNLSPADPPVIMRWREGKLERRLAEFTQFTVREAQLSPINCAVIELSSEIQGIGWGEPVVAKGKVVGLVSSQDGRNCVAIPSRFVHSIIEARKKGAYTGLGYFHFYWQPAEDPDSLAWLNLPGDPRGVIVTQVPMRPDGGTNVLKARDILLAIDGFNLDIQGDYMDPDFGALMLENLAVTRKWAGDAVKLKVWRHGSEMELNYRLPRMAYTNSLVPNATFDHDPEYMIVGGLVFQPLTESYLQAWGSDWKRRAPFRLNFFREESPNKKRPALVLLSQILPDPYNIGYQEHKYLVVDTVNGRAVHYLSELQEALKHDEKGYHVVNFQKGESLRTMVVAAGAAEKDATDRVLKRYSIPKQMDLGEDK